MSKILVTCSHPDDETLGMGGTLYLNTKKGNEIFVLIFADGETSRGMKTANVEKRKKQSKDALSILGITKSKFLNYDDQKLDSVPLIELAQEIEKIISQWKPEIVYTHFWGDVNQDHKAVFKATQIAVRPTPSQIVKELICFEIPSSTEWGVPNETFVPNFFINIKSSIKRKIQAFEKYDKEVMKFPHPRSSEGIQIRSKYWGSTVGLEFAEAFIKLREIRVEV